MPIPEVPRTAIEAALVAFDRDLRHTPDWFSWQSDQRYRWALVRHGREYPVKQIIRMATGYTRFSGGEHSGQANAYLRRFGFNIRAVSGPGGRARNPVWSYDELILALDLYVRFGLLDDHHPEVIALSDALRRLPVHTVAPDAVAFRNANAVAMKLANFARLDPAYVGAGLPRGGKRDAEIWDRFSGDVAHLSILADALRAGAAVPDRFPSLPEEGEDEVQEGRLLYRYHCRRERSPALVKKKKAHVVAKTGRLACEVCGFDFETRYGAIGAGFIECHHRIPLAQAGVTTTQLTDLAVVCSNCHQMLHRQKPWGFVEDLALMLIKKESGFARARKHAPEPGQSDSMS
jgi:5-methylcytosine-specific restriction enzyme A